MVDSLYRIWEDRVCCCREEWQLDQHATGTHRVPHACNPQRETRTGQQGGAWLPGQSQAAQVPTACTMCRSPVEGEALAKLVAQNEGAHCRGNGCRARVKPPARGMGAGHASSRPQAAMCGSCWAAVRNSKARRELRGGSTNVGAHVRATLPCLKCMQLQQCPQTGHLSIPSSPDARQLHATA